MDIQVTGRKLNCDFLCLGMQGDNAVERLRFILPRFTGAGVDLSKGIAYAVYSRADGEAGYAILDISDGVDPETINIDLLVGSEMTARPGKLRFGIKISGAEAQMWSSELATVTVGATLLLPSPQPFMLMSTFTDAPAPLFLTAPDTLAPYAQPITVVERTLLIPALLQTIAVASDDASALVRIIVPRFWNEQDWSSFDFSLHTEMAGKGVDDVYFNDTNGNTKTVKDTIVELIWVLRPPQTSYEGKLSLQLRVETEGFIWHTLTGQVTVASHLTGEPVIPVTPTAFEQMLNEMKIIRDEAKAIEQLTKVWYDSIYRIADGGRPSTLREIILDGGRPAMRGGS